MLAKSMNRAATRVLSSLNPRPPSRYPDWASILKPDSARWDAARAAARGGPRVLITNSAGIDHHISTGDTLLAVALTLRGADVHVLLCDEALPACVMAHSKRVAPEEFAKVGPAEHLCGRCFRNGSKVFRALGLPTHRYSEFITPEDQGRAEELSRIVPAADIPSFRLDGIEIGEHALAGALRYFARGDLRDEPLGEAVLRRYFRASLLSTFAIRRLLRTLSFRTVCGHKGMYVPDGLIGEVARQEHVGTVAWAEAYRKQTFIFSHHDTYHRTMRSEPTAHWENMPWTADMEADVVEYLKSRWYGTHDWIGYVQDWSDDVSAIAADLGIDFTKPCIGLLTNVIWDAQVHYGGNAFANMVEWTLETIRYFARRPDLQLIVRVHPAEVKGAHRSRQLMVDEIKRAIPNQPRNVFVIPPDSPMNTYAAMLKCNAVLIYGTHTGVELASVGVPVIVAGEAWIRGKGLTLDASSAQEYFDILDRLPLREGMSDVAVQRAKRYAYHYFFRRLIPLPFLQHSAGEALFKLDINGIDDLLPGRYPGLDVICDGILRGEEFIYPAERQSGNFATSGKFTTNYSATLSVSRGSKPLVSVVMPTYNHAHWLPGALASVYEQDGSGTHFDIEVILVDNASSDDTPQVARQYSGTQYIRLEKTTALATARNVGLKEARGTYLAFLEDGDLWSADRLRSQVAVLERHPEFGAVYGQCIASSMGKDTLWPAAGTAPAGSVLPAFLKGEYVLPSFLTTRREALEKAGYFDESLRGMEMYEMLLRLAGGGRFAFVSGPVGTSPFSKDSVWARRIQRREHHTELPYILSKTFARMPVTADMPALRRSVVSHWFGEIARRLDEPGAVAALRAHVLFSIRTYPWMMSRRSLLAYTKRVVLRTLGAR